VQVRILREF